MTEKGVGKQDRHTLQEGNKLYLSIIFERIPSESLSVFCSSVVELDLVDLTTQR